MNPLLKWISTKTTPDQFAVILLGLILLMAFGLYKLVTGIV